MSEGVRLDHNVTAADAARDPLWLVHRYDPTKDHFHMLHLSRAQHRAATFLTDEYLPTDLPLAVFRRTELVAAMPPAGPLHFIFHSAFCLSTVLARAFDRPGVAMGVKEPPLFNDLVGWRRRGGEPARVATVLDQGMNLLSRPFGRGEAIIVKPSNVINSLAAAILSMRPQAKALLLHAPLQTYLTSVAKKGLIGRSWARELVLGLVREGQAPLGLDPEQLFGQTDIQVAAVGWLAQHEMFHGLVKLFGPQRVRTLDSETLTARPVETIAALAKLYDLELDQSAVQDIAKGPAFTRHSKFGNVFDAAARAEEYRNAGAAHADEIEKVTHWATVIAQGAGIPLILPAALLE